ncbi:hypothetical protein ACA910_010702 [Epithemia clementina (nom. ined.)]
MTFKVEEAETDITELSASQGSLGIIAGEQITQHGKRTKSPAYITAPVTPVDDKGVEEKTGRWSEAEHKIFLEGLEQYGKQWKTISTMIGTRTVVQVRTHAQKFFQKMERKNKTKASSVPDLPQTQNRASKRKSLPTSLPSRKKANKTLSPPKQTVSRTSSLSLVNTISCSSDLPTYVSTGSLSSGTWSSESPVGVSEFDHADSFCGTSDPQLVLEESTVELETDALPSEDPLDWLIDGGIGHLPESSLDQAPIFPDALDLPSENFVLEAKSEEQVSYPVLQDIADPKVTVQSLFLEDGDDHLP